MNGKFNTFWAVDQAGSADQETINAGNDYATLIREPILSTLVGLMPLILHNWFTVVPYRLAIFERVSPDLIVWYLLPDEAVPSFAKDEALRPKLQNSLDISNVSTRRV